MLLRWISKAVAQHGDSKAAADAAQRGLLRWRRSASRISAWLEICGVLPLCSLVSRVSCALTSKESEQCEVVNVVLRDAIAMSLAQQLQTLQRGE